MNNIDELMTKLGNDKYKNVSSNLEFLTECGVESSDHVDMLKDAIEYIDLLENSVQYLTGEKSRTINNRLVHGTISMTGCESGRFQTDKPNCIEIFTSAKSIQEEINPLILEYKALEEKSEKLWAAGNSQYNIAGEHYLDRYEKISFDMAQIEHLLKVKYNYNILKSEGSVNNDM